MNNFRLLLTGYSSAAENMAIDETLAESCRKNGETILRFYFWKKPSITIGYFQDPSKEINIDFCKKNNIDIVRRITGGRGVYHEEGITYTVVSATKTGPFPKNLKESLRVISEGILAGLKKLGVYDAELFIPECRQEKKRNLSRLPFCFGSTSLYEIVAGGRKIVGSAQRRWTDILIQQGHIPFNHHFSILPDIFQKFNKEKMEQSVTSLSSYLAYETFCEEAEDSMLTGFEKTLAVNLTKDKLTPDEIEFTKKLMVEKYQTESWNLHRKTK